MNHNFVRNVVLDSPKQKSKRIDYFDVNVLHPRVEAGLHDYYSKTSLEPPKPQLSLSPKNQSSYVGHEASVVHGRVILNPLVLPSIAQKMREMKQESD